jgi:hypothetical protein
MDKKDLCEHTRIRLIAAALGHQHCTATDGTEVQIQGTGKRILIGDDAYLAKVALPAAVPDATAEILAMLGRPDPFGTEQQAQWYQRLCAARSADQPLPVPKGAVVIWRVDLVLAMAELLQLRAYREHHLAKEARKQAGLQQLADQAQEMGGYDVASVTDSEGGHHD